MRHSLRLLFFRRPTPSVPPSSTSLSNNAEPPFDFEGNPYRARTSWPPDFSKLPPSAKFSYERTFRRRSKLKWARPTFNKWLITIQNIAILGTLSYALLLMDWTDGGKRPEPKIITTIRGWWNNAGKGWNADVKKLNDKIERKDG